MGYNPGREMPNLLNLSGKWFKFSDYEIIEVNNIEYIIPTNNSEIEWYNPFDNYPKILYDFLNLYLSLSKRNKEYTQKPKQAIIGFVKRYGLFGLMWEDILDFHFTTKNKLLYLKQTSFASVSSLVSKLINKELETPLNYDKYASVFLPRLNKPYPDVSDNEQLFFKNYSEPIKFIKIIIGLGIIGDHYDNWRKLNTGEDVNVKELNLELFDMDFHPKVKRTDNNWHIEWSYKNLRNALGLMYILNFTENIGDQSIKLCKKCGLPFIVGGSDGRMKKAKYCSDSCGNAARVARYRKNNNKNKNPD